jgi:hypothetical protein
MYSNTLNAIYQIELNIQFNFNLNQNGIQISA